MLEFGYHRPRNLTDLWGVLQSAEAPVGLLAGGTDLVPALKRELTAPGALVDIKTLPELQGIASAPDGGMRLGAAVTLRALARSPEVAHAYPTLAETAATVASYQIRNRGTLGGNLCLDTRCTYFNQSPFWRAEYPDCRKTGGASCYVVPKGKGCHALSSSDLAPLLIAMGARAETTTPAGSRTVALEEIYSDTGLHALALGPNVLLTSVLLPPRTALRAVYRRFSTRESIDFPTLSVAAAATPDGDSRIVVGHVASRPLRAPQAEQNLTAFLRGEGGDPASIGEIAANELNLASSVRGSVAYKKRMLRILVADVASELSTTDKGSS